MCRQRCQPADEAEQATRPLRLAELGIGPRPTALAEIALKNVLHGAERFRRHESVHQGTSLRLGIASALDDNLEDGELTPSIVVLATDSFPAALLDQPHGDVCVIRAQGGRLDDTPALLATTTAVQQGARLVVVLSHAPAAAARQSVAQRGSPYCGRPRLKPSASCPSMVGLPDEEEELADLSSGSEDDYESLSPSTGLHSTALLHSAPATSPPVSAAPTAGADGDELDEPLLPLLPTCCNSSGRRRPRLGAEAPANAYVAALLAWQLICTQLPADVSEEVLVVAGEYDASQRRTRLIQVQCPACPGWAAGLAASSAELGSPATHGKVN